jgi:cell wall-associated NlpC family hydrolase
MGARYVWGAEGPTEFDCSGFVKWAYAQVGISLSHYSGAMYNETVRISESQLQPGDLVFWGPGGSAHVAIYIGGNQVLHTAHGVAITSMNGWWAYGPVMSFGRIP